MVGQQNAEPLPGAARAASTSYVAGAGATVLAVGPTLDAVLDGHRGPRRHGALRQHRAPVRRARRCERCSRRRRWCSSSRTWPVRRAGWSPTRWSTVPHRLLALGVQRGGAAEVRHARPAHRRSRPGCGGSPAGARRVPRRSRGRGRLLRRPRPRGVVAEGAASAALTTALRPAQSALESVLDLLAGLLHVGLALLGLALSLHRLVAGRVAELLLGLADQALGLVRGSCRRCSCRASVRWCVPPARTHVGRKPFLPATTMGLRRFSSAGRALAL